MSRLRFAFILAVLGGATILGACGGGTSASPTSPAAPLANVAELLGERSVGSATAPVTIIQYSSLTCPHCATFHVVTWPLIRAAYVDGGQVRLVYRDFPLDSTALAGASLARCAGASRFFQALDLLYAKQATWTSAGDSRAAMKQALAPIGMTSSEMDSCLASSELQNGIQQIRQDGQSRDGITAVPSFMINGRKVVGALPFSEFDAIIKGFLTP